MWSIANQKKMAIMHRNTARNPRKTAAYEEGIARRQPEPALVGAEGRPGPPKYRGAGGTGQRAI